MKRTTIGTISILMLLMLIFVGCVEEKGYCPVHSTTGKLIDVGKDINGVTFLLDINGTYKSIFVNKVNSDLNLTLIGITLVAKNHKNDTVKISYTTASSECDGSYSYTLHKFEILEDIE